MYHKAQYDEYGNIILPSDIPDEQQSIVSECSSQNEHCTTVPDSERSILEHEDINMQHSRVQRNKRREILPPLRTLLFGPKRMIGDVQNAVTTTTNQLIEEGKNQYSVSLQEGKQQIEEVKRTLPKIAERTWKFLAQPVWILAKNKAPKKRSRGVLFVTDVFRFGGTFAFIFSALFISLNFDSFSQIIQNNVSPIQQIQRINEQTSDIDSVLRTNLLKSPVLATAGQTNGELLSFLPEVGPPDNRVIIPKLGLNVPLVTPSYESLLNEDWDQVETDIQDALKLGVVHYPGTARPGQAGNFFLTGHSSYYPWAAGNYKTVFARLHQLEPGDEYYVYYGGDKHRYIVREKKEVKPSNVNVLDQPLDRRISTMMTCSPVGTTLRRLIVISDEVDPDTGVIMAVGEKQKHEIKKAKPAMLPI